MVLMVWGLPASYFVECLRDFICLLFFWGHFRKEKTEVWKNHVNEYVIVMWRHHMVSTFIMLCDYCICQPSLLPFAYFFLPPSPGIQSTKSTPTLKCRGKWAWPPAEAGWPPGSSFEILLRGSAMFSPPSMYPFSLLFNLSMDSLYLL